MTVDNETGANPAEPGASSTFTLTINKKTLAIAASVVTVLAIALYFILRQSPAEAGAEYGKELAEQGRMLGTPTLGGLSGRQLGSCVGESFNRYPHDEGDRDEFTDACTDAARDLSY
ncbi:hypothetical protein [Streptomyces sp. NBC_01205]|uniref:hypothetical protein n=1 Tax=Streptomyces sp. NBC_01205 TaxID=2903771 RepID=UPI002E0E586F|nr:hypothetical protein OG573_42770 [Streptomyces sp. NBC_01205]